MRRSPSTMTSFNSHAPVGARCTSKRSCFSGHVSIHTPPWGRDFAIGASTCHSRFQFTRPRGGAIPWRPARTPCRCFNSHAPVGARSAFKANIDHVVVSIHTPPWGRDNHLPPSILPRMFQFTRPRGGAITTTNTPQCGLRFNSHAPVGARYAVADCTFVHHVSIHTPPWGRDLRPRR